MGPNHDHEQAKLKNERTNEWIGMEAIQAKQGSNQSSGAFHSISCSFLKHVKTSTLFYPYSYNKCIYIYINPSFIHTYLHTLHT
mmetsp:Transcript_15164/g.17024  ORF Transcript_15164/g.17024 Transcript_15164/m.17024 type:complete len:84 (-) Transcript_15164:334-585(-)